MEISIYPWLVSDQSKEVTQLWRLQCRYSVSHDIKCIVQSVVFLARFERVIHLDLWYNACTFLSGGSRSLQLLAFSWCSSSNFRLMFSIDSCSISQNPARSWDTGRGWAFGFCQRKRKKDYTQNICSFGIGYITEFARIDLYYINARTRGSEGGVGRGHQMLLCCDWLVDVCLPSFPHRGPGTAGISVTSAAARCPPRYESCLGLHAKTHDKVRLECAKTEVQKYPPRIKYGAHGKGLTSRRLVTRHTRTSDVWSHWCSICAKGATFDLRDAVMRVSANNLFNSVWLSQGYRMTSEDVE